MSNKSNRKQENEPDFEHALSELENLVSRLESGELNLDQSLEHFKRGVELTRRCQSILDQAQKAVEILITADGQEGQVGVDESN